MEKITFEIHGPGALSGYQCMCCMVDGDNDHSGTYYRASEVDALIADVRVLVENIVSFISIVSDDNEFDKDKAISAKDRFIKALAAVEARLKG